jgi:hypothetical protein
VYYSYYSRLFCNDLPIILYRITSYHTKPYYITSYYVLPYYIKSHHILSCHIISYPIIVPYHRTLSYPTLSSYPIISYPIIVPCHILSHQIIMKSGCEICQSKANLQYSNVTYFLSYRLVLHCPFLLFFLLFFLV